MNLSLFRTVSLRHLLREPLRTLLILFGIALGVAVFISVRIANVSSLEAFRSTLGVVSGPANLIIRGTAAPLPDKVFPKVWRLPGVLGAAPRVEGTVSLVPSGIRTSREEKRKSGSPSLMILGIDPFTQSDLQYVPTTGEDSGDSYDASQLSFLTQPNVIVVADAFAQRNGLHAGSTFGVTVSGETKTLTVLGVLPHSDLSRAFGDDIGVMDIANAQELLGKVGRLDRIDLHTAPQDEAKVMKAIQGRLPTGVTVGPPSTRMRQAEQMVSAFQLNLTALSLISALVGVFIIYNALLIAVLRRRKEIATLRSLGVTRRGITALFLVEAALLGVIGSSLGLVLGTWLARFTLRAVSGTISTLYLQVRARELVITPETLLLGLGLGVGAALIAGCAPALEAAATPPAETLRERTAARPAKRRAGPWLAAGIGLIVAAGLASVLPGLREMQIMGFAGALFLMLGAALTTPALILSLGDVTQKLYRRLFGIEGGLAVHEIRAALDRSAAVIAALGVAVAMLIGLALMVGSFRQTVGIWIDQTLRADLFIGPTGQEVSGVDAVLPKDVLPKVRALSGVAAVDTYRSRPIQIGNQETNLSASDLKIRARFGHLWLRKGDSESVLSRISGKSEAVVSENFARRFKVREGDSVHLVTPTGPATLTVRGVYYDYSSDAGVLLLDRAVYARLWKDEAISNLALYLKPGISGDAVREAFLRRLGGKYDLRVVNNAELRRNVLNIFDQTFAITYALQIIAVLVAMLGIGNALLAILLQRQREIGILRAIGASKGQIVRISLLEASLLATWGHLVGSLSGIVLAVHLVYVINRQFFGWTLQFRITPMPFLLSYGLVSVAALVAAIPPSRKAVGVSVAEAVRTE
jgi:putative ABC transport system permease protein